MGAAAHRELVLHRPWRGLRVVGALVCLGAVALAIGLATGAIDVAGRSLRGSDLATAILLALPGVLLMGARHDRDLLTDPLRVRVVRGLFAPLWRSVTPISEPRAVSVARLARGSGNQTRIVHPITIDHAGGSLELAAPAQAAAARRLAERVARAAAVPLHDRLEGSVIVRAPDALDVSVRHGVTEADLVAPRPAASRVDALAGNETTRIVVRAAPLGWAYLCLLSLPAFGVLVFWAAYWIPLSKEAPAVLRFAPLAIVAVAMIMAVLRFRESGFAPCTLRLGRDAVRWHGHRVAPDELEDVRVIDQGIVAHLRLASDEVIASVGRGLRADDLRYLRAELLRALVRHG